MLIHLAGRLSFLCLTCVAFPPKGIGRSSTPWDVVNNLREDTDVWLFVSDQRGGEIRVQGWPEIPRISERMSHNDQDVHLVLCQNSAGSSPPGFQRRSDSTVSMVKNLISLDSAPCRDGRCKVIDHLVADPGWPVTQRRPDPRPTATGIMAPSRVSRCGWARRPSFGTGRRAVAGGSILAGHNRSQQTDRQGSCSVSRSQMSERAPASLPWNPASSSTKLLASR